MTEFGPTQFLVVGFEGNHFTGAIAAELERLKEAGTVRVLDVVFVAKDADGTVTAIEGNQLDAGEASELGAKIGALAGLGGGGVAAAAAGAELDADAGAGGGLLSTSEADIKDIADSIPPDTSAALVLLEHEWMNPLREAVIAAGGRPLADAWVRPGNLEPLPGALAK